VPAIPDPAATAICPDCHALVLDLRAHKQWHSHLVASIATAVQREIERHQRLSG
jgi:hypothetical protein